MTVSFESFDNKESFLEWLESTKSSPEGESRRVLHIGYDPISWCVLAAVGRRDARPSWARRVCPIPNSRQESASIWNEEHERHLCLFFQVDLSVQTMIIGIRRSIWDALCDECLPTPKGKFVEISPEEAESLVENSKNWNAMGGEVQSFGMSCRIVQR